VSFPFLPNITNDLGIPDPWVVLCLRVFNKKEFNKIALGQVKDNHSPLIFPVGVVVLLEVPDVPPANPVVASYL
jgi:hypothetical protein